VQHSSSYLENAGVGPALTRSRLPRNLRSKREQHVPKYRQPPELHDGDDREYGDVVDRTNEKRRYGLNYGLMVGLLWCLLAWLGAMRLIELLT
jgi:hypothetical protein